MFNSSVLDIVVGLIFTFLAISLAVSAIVEAWAGVMQWRSKTLLNGIKQLVNDPNLDGLALHLYNHALINPRDEGGAKDESGLKRLPSYIDPKQFADALIDIAKITPEAPDQINRAIAANITNHQVQQMLTGIVNRAEGKIDKIRDGIANWFDNGMDRVSGEYKRWTQLYSFAIGFGIAAICNISTIAVAKALWLQPMLAHSIVADPNVKVGQALDQLNTLQLPVGWPLPYSGHSLSVLEILIIILGWLITALAALFGAPFWFDALGQVVRLRASGPSPHEKRTAPS